MDLLIDTSVIIQIERASANLENLPEALGDGASYLAAITASELLHGVYRANSETRRAGRQRFVTAVLDSIPLLAFGLDAAIRHAQLWSDLRQRGEMIGAHDLLIAATALNHNLAVLTANRRDFERVEELEVKVWPTL